MTANNTAIVRRVYDEILNQENKALIDELYAADVILHDPFMGTQTGREAFKQLLGVFDTGFPHHRVEVQQTITEGDWVAVVHMHTATHTGVFNGLPPTGKTVRVPGVEVFRLAEGRIVEFWRHDDDLGLLMQLGAVPAPAAA